MPEQPFRFRFRVRYGECDAQGVVFNARYADFVDIAVNEYVRTLHLEFFRHGDGQSIADADITYVVIQPSKMAKVVIPDSLRDKLQTGAPGVLISHAGETA